MAKKKLKKKKVFRKISTKKVGVKRLAAIDIGSNAIRMVLASHSSQGLKIHKKFRFPIRLGADVFDKGKISAKNLKLSARIFKKFKELSEINHVDHLRAVGTSALREAKNGKDFVDLIYEKSRIRIEIIDGVEEARLIHLAVKREIELENNRALLIDIGGGSVELTFSDEARMTATQSFPFGTVRTLELLKKRHLKETSLPLVIGEFLSPLTNFISSHSPNSGSLDFAIGTGGNLETLGKLKPALLRAPSPTFLTFGELKTLIEKIQKLSVRQRVQQLGLRPDRADVIVPAALVILTVLRQAGVDKLLIPHVGLKDGLLWSMANEMSYRV